MDAVLNLAHALRFMREVDGSNRSELIDEMIRRTNLDPKNRLPWCAAFVAWVGYAVCRKEWPLARVAGCASLYDDAKAKGLVVETGPQRGDIFLLWGKAHDGKTRFFHTGFVQSVLEDGRCTTIEGNTDDGGSANGDGTYERVRTFKAADRFIRWYTPPPVAVVTAPTFLGFLKGWWR